MSPTDDARRLATKRGTMRSSISAFTSVAFVGGLSLLLAACPDSSDDRCADGACVATSGEGGPDAGDAGGDAPIDPCVETPSDPKCLDESTALFVSAKGDATGADGTRAKPFKTIGAALAAVTPARKRVYVCEGTYAEKVTVQVAGASILGGLACDWNGKGANPKIAPAKGVALAIMKTSGVVVTDVDIEGNADTQVPGDSAIATFVSESTNVLFRRVTIKAGPGTNAGAAGANGDASPNYSVAVAPNGLSTTTAAAAEAPECGQCADGSFSTGGKGASTVGSPLPGGAMPAVGINNAGGTVGATCVEGKVGAPGNAGAAATGATRPGSANAAGWKTLSDAAKGPNGNPGQGGGGAGHDTVLGGGSGGCGGCGGTGATAGGSGGSSIALLAFNSDVMVQQSKLTSAKAGDGAAGGKGQDGQRRGGPGNGACGGGFGGHGAGGGGGGGGAGGHSAAIAYTGTAPVATSSTLEPGAGGALGVGGDPGLGSGNPGVKGLDGAKGSSAEVLPL